MGIVYKIFGVTLYGFCILWALFELMRFKIINKKAPIIDVLNPVQHNPKEVVTKKVRKVSDITTEILREQRYYNDSIKRMMRHPDNIEEYRQKLEPINIRLSIKQTKP